MQDTRYNILVWLPSPMGDAILCTPALRAIRRHFKSSRIAFFARPEVRQVLSPSSFNDIWLQQQSKNPFAVANMLKAQKFTHAILFKNSFGSGLAAFLAKIPSRIGYAREGRGFLLTEKLYPQKLPGGKFKPNPMIDYYLAIASALGADTADRNLELLIDPQEEQKLQSKLPEVAESKGPVVVIVPGGAFGPSKCWPSDRFAQTADWLITNYNATVVVSVASNTVERQIAGEICDSSKHKLINLADRPISLGELKAFFSGADLVISNDTGPRHIAIALRRRIISLFGPNDPAWTDTGYENEIQLIGDVPCAPCGKPICKKAELLCMQAITVEMVCDAAKRLFEGNVCHSERSEESPHTQRYANLSCQADPSALPQDDKGDIQRQCSRGQKFTEVSKSLFIDPDYETAFSELGLTSIDAVFSFNSGKDPGGSRLPKHRSRLQFDISNPAKILFLKRYDNPGVLTQLKNWFWHNACKSMMSFDLNPTKDLTRVGIKTPKTISYGEQWDAFFEKRSFIITEQIPNAQSLEQKLPDCFQLRSTTENLKRQRKFIIRLSRLAKKFHDTGYCHRDFYLAHIFYSDDGTFYLIDLQRAFKPRFLAERFRVKDIAQLYYSAPGSAFSKTDRLRFYKSYTGKRFLDQRDKAFICKVFKKVERIAKHDAKHGRSAPFTT